MKKCRDGKSPTDAPKEAKQKGQTGTMQPFPNSDGHVQKDVIATGLKKIFDDVVEEAIPPEFLALLEQIDRKSD
ncbi:MAG: NepR family anti-sigma factor [Micropepsaceae bacterium]